MAQGGAGGDADKRWIARPITGRTLRALAVVAPIVVGAVGAIVLSHILPTPTSPASSVLWWVLLVLGASVPYLVVARAARRLLPLAVLLELSMLFPDEAPSRLNVARRAGRTRDLKKRVEDLKRSDAAGESTKVAASVLELITHLGVHDRRTRGHSERVRALTDMLADEIRLAPDDRDRLRWAALLHDLGKLTVPDDVLNKPGRLDGTEWDILRQHPTEGVRIAAPLWTWMGPWIGAIEQHHERFDGSGYPNGLADREISLSGRIVAVTDAFETMTAARPYKKPMSVAAAREELVRSSGTHFDPLVVRRFLEIPTRRLWVAAGLLAFVAQLPILHLLWSRGVAARLGRSGGGMVATGATVAALAIGGLVGVPARSPAPETVPPPLSAPAEPDRVEQSAAEPRPSRPRGEGSTTDENGVLVALAEPDPEDERRLATRADNDGGREPRREDERRVEDPPRPPFRASGELVLANPLESMLAGVTQSDFEARCDIPPTQGVDGWVFKLPDGYPSEGARVLVSGSNSLAPYALNAYFYSEGCEPIGAFDGPDDDESGSLPSGTSFVVVNETSAPGTTIRLAIE